MCLILGSVYYLIDFVISCSHIQLYLFTLYPDENKPSVFAATSCRSWQTDRFMWGVVPFVEM